MALQPKEAELFIGIVAGIGADTKAVHSTLSRVLTEYGYDTVDIKITDALKELDGIDLPSNLPTIERYDQLVAACNSLREKTDQNDVMARLAVSRIVFERTNRGGDVLKRRAYIINQLKRPEESELLRSLYGEQYVQVSCHARAAAREARLADLIAHDHPQKPKASDWMAEARQLVRKDEAEEELHTGQRMRDVFPLSDVVFDVTKRQSIIKQVDRFLRALFGDFRITPTVDEHAMQLANVAALRSADLSRQVGAAIINDHAEIQALGCNEVPKAGGGTYWSGDDPDGREFQLEKDSNDERKAEVLLDLAGRMQKAGLLKDEFSDARQLGEALLNRQDKLIEDSQFMDSLEYGRSIHAEMNAITDAARTGHSVRDCTLCCNTFPCHNCTKHIVAAGIRRVVFLRPYPKSYAEDLFSDSIVIEPENPSDRRVSFEPFIGICGPMYERVFSKRKWKIGGTVPPFDKKTASFVRRTPAPAYVATELVVQTDLGELLLAAGLSPKKPQGED
ncbi:MAG TPA: anti-phage dCTP deaminase [Caulobacteraceae bacterium]|jgi:cytidine deaminase|nr:anti-phage dCTP deaminase [Caulobacteraceae bacterium]